MNLKFDQGIRPYSLLLLWRGLSKGEQDCYGMLV